MNAKLDVRSAIRESTTAFRRFPVLLCLPVVSIGLANWGLGSLIYPSTGKSPSSLLPLIMVFAMGYLVFISVAEVLTAAMYLRAREGVEPSLKQTDEVVRYRGLFPLMGKLLLLYLALGLLLGVICGVAVFVIMFASTLIHIAHQSSSGIGVAAGGIGRIGIAIGMAVFLVMWSRYMFVLPMLAIARSAGPDFLNECVRRAKPVWRTAIWVQLAAGLPMILVIVIRSPTWWHLTPPHAVRVTAKLILLLIEQCFAAWFILVKTGLALQLMPAYLPQGSGEDGLSTGPVPQ